MARRDGAAFLEKVSEQKGTRTVEWWKDRIENLEADFVEYLVQTCLTGDILAETEWKLMDDILELRDWLNEMLEEEKASQ